MKIQMPSKFKCLLQDTVIEDRGKITKINEYNNIVSRKLGYVKDFTLKNEGEVVLSLKLNKRIGEKEECLYVDANPHETYSSYNTYYTHIYVMGNVNNSPYSFKYTDCKRYKVFYGGRGAGKSVSIAISLLLIAAQRKVRVLCGREYMASIKDSVYKLLCDMIDRYKIPGYRVLKSSIENIITGSEFIFRGFWQHANEIKSMQGIKYCWIEEGQALSQSTIDVLIPTIRDEESEIWISFNPTYRDPVYKTFIETDRDDTLAKKVNYYDNPFFPDVLRREMEYDKSTDYDKYKHIWLGEPIIGQTRVYRFKPDINLVEKPLGYDPSLETWASWDFGVAPSTTAIIVYQVQPLPYGSDPASKSGGRINIIAEHENQDKPVTYYVNWIRSLGFNDIIHAVDPAGNARDSKLESWVSLMRNYGLKVVYKTKYRVHEQIDNANRIIPLVRVCGKQCPKVVDMFYNWSYKTNSAGEIERGALPQHDKYSHFGTSFYYFAVNKFPPKNVGGEIRFA